MGAIIFLTQANNNGLITKKNTVKNEKDQNFTKMNSLNESYENKLDTESILSKDKLLFEKRKCLDNYNTESNKDKIENQVINTESIQNKQSNEIKNGQINQKLIDMDNTVKNLKIIFENTSLETTKSIHNLKKNIINPKVNNFILI